MDNKVTILFESDGWQVIMPNGQQYRWNHNDEDLGTEALSVLLTDLGYDVTVEESY